MENLMPRYYFNLASKDANIPDDSGKELSTLNDAYEHAGKLPNSNLSTTNNETTTEFEPNVL
jgi:hypothetical protein